MIWDLHCHLTGIAGETPEQRMARLVDAATRMGVRRILVSMGLKFLTQPTAEDLVEQNNQVLAALSHHHDRAFGLCYVSPSHPEASLAEIERCLGQGPMVGIKLWVANRAREAALDALIERTAKYRGIVLQHSWAKTDGTQLPGESTPVDVAELARRHPRAQIVCGHSGGTWEVGIRAIRDCPNVAVETAGFDPTAGMVEMAVRELGAERVIYGSDAPGRSFASQLAKIYGAEIPETAKRQILGGNLRRWLFPRLKETGVPLE
ncbi:MAG: amidohydrolase family protein [Planctomycetaceae bacterium]|jgi:predicted TIM-barrel fold metal-dependent hydrolase